MPNPHGWTQIPGITGFAYREEGEHLILYYNGAEVKAVRAELEKTAAKMPRSRQYENRTLTRLNAGKDATKNQVAAVKLAVKLMVEGTIPMSQVGCAE